MNLTTQHIEVRCSSLDKAKDFYLHKLGLELISNLPELGLFAVKAGSIRISFFEGYIPRKKQHDQLTGSHIIFRTENLDETIEELVRRGIEFTGEIVEAGGFMRDIAIRDPDGNIIEIAEYFVDPLAEQDH